MGKLTALSVKNAKPGRHGDGAGLYLLVKPSGARSWLLRVQRDGKRRDVGLGSLAALSLAEAREKLPSCANMPSMAATLSPSEIVTAALLRHSETR